LLTRWLNILRTNHEGAKRQSGLSNGSFEATLDGLLDIGLYPCAHRFPTNEREERQHLTSICP